MAVRAEIGRDTNLSAYLLGLDPETVWMHFFANGCDICPAHEYCEHQPDGTCCRENFMGWSKEART